MGNAYITRRGGNGANNGVNFLKKLGDGYEGDTITFNFTVANKGLFVIKKPSYDSGGDCALFISPNGEVTHFEEFCSTSSLSFTVDAVSDSSITITFTKIVHNSIWLVYEII